MNKNPINAILRFLYEEIILFWICHESHVKNEKTKFLFGNHNVLSYKYP